MMKLFLTCALSVIPAFGGPLYLMTLDTSHLTAGPYDLYFSFIDGSGAGDANNTVTVNNFSCTSCALSPVVLTDTMFFQDSTNPVTLGMSLSFNLAFTNNLDAGGVPDTFEFKLLDPNAVGGPAPIATTDPITGEDLIAFDLNGPPDQILAYGSADPNFPFSAPVVTSAAPEPSTVLLMLPALLVSVVVRRTPTPPRLL